MKFNQIIIFINRVCPVNCSTCNAGINRDTSFLDEDFFHNFSNWLKTGQYPEYVILTGGEPFLSFPSLSSAVKTFNESGCSIEILTSGVWFIKNPEYLKTLKKYGEFNLRISLDEEHVTSVSLDTIKSLLFEAERLNIDFAFTVREIPQSEYTVKFYKEFLKNMIPDIYEKNRDNSRWIHIIPQINLPDKKYKLPQNNSFKKKCFLGFRDLIIGNNGLLYPCCGLFSHKNHKRLAICNPLETEYKEIEELINNNEFYMDLKNSGPYEMSKRHNISINIKEKLFSTNCEYCLEILKRNILKHYQFFFIFFPFITQIS